jgi:hypothetical protein
VKTTILAACVLASISTAASAASSTPCLTASEHDAALVRQLQTELMVAALKCAGHSADLSGRYNTFVRKFGKEIGANGDTLRGYFSRAYGSGHARSKMDAYITSLANDAVMKTINEPGFCDNMTPVFDKVLTLDGKDLGTYAGETIRRTGTLVACSKK